MQDDRAEIVVVRRAGGAQRAEHLWMVFSRTL